MAKYKFKGYTITCCGYHQPDHCVWWEACNDDGLACFHGNTLREVEFMILDSEWEDKLRAKDREVAELRECLKEALSQRCMIHPTLKCKGCAYEKENCSKWRKALEGAK